MAMAADCPFCERILHDDVEETNAVAAAFPDAYPISPGHTLVVPVRHEADLFLLEPSDRRGMWELVDAVKLRLQSDHQPDGFNIGVNVGAAAGQTVWHAHVHVVPRFVGDVEDPRGGVRWVLPAAASYDSHGGALRPH